MSLTILKGFRHAEQFLGPGREKELLATNPTTEQLEGWQKRGLIEGVDTGEIAVPDTLLEALRLTADEVQSQMLDILEAEVEESETPLETLNRIVSERNAAENDFEDLQNSVEATLTYFSPVEGIERGESESALGYLQRLGTHLSLLAEDSAAVLKDSIGATTQVVANPQTSTTPLQPAFLTAEELTKVLGSPKAAMALLDAKFDTREKLIAASDKALEDLPELGEARVKKLREWLAG